MVETRGLILEYLRSHPNVSALEISAALGMTRANIRHHLDRLIEQDLIVQAGKQPPGGRGRPTFLFRLSRSAQRHNLEGLAGALLAEFLEGLPYSDQQHALERLSRRITAPPDPLSTNLTRRVTEAVQRLNDLAYQARWEAHREGPRIFLIQRPYGGLFTRFPDLLSRLDACVIEILVGIPVEQKSPPEATPCIYRIIVG